MANILLLVNDPPLRHLIAAALIYWLPAHALTIVTSPAEAAGRLAARRYALVVLTNWGVVPRAAVDVVPADRQYPVIFLTGFRDQEIEHECKAKAIPYLLTPLETPSLRQELRLALGDLAP